MQNTWYSKECKVIVVKNSRTGPVGPYNIFEFFLKSGQKIGEISEQCLESYISDDFND